MSARLKRGADVGPSANQFVMVIDGKAVAAEGGKEGEEKGGEVRGGK